MSLSTAPIFVDLETTGLYAEAHDRIVELALLELDEGSRIVREFCTLINPNRDLGPRSVHGLLARDVLAAPTFAEVAHEVFGLLRGRIVVGHNVRFDLKFLEREFARLGSGLPIEGYVCTLEMTRAVDPSLPRRLDGLAEALGIPNEQSHHARSDALKAAQVFRALHSQAAAASNPRMFAHVWERAGIASAPPRSVTIPTLCPRVEGGLRAPRDSQSLINRLARSLPAGRGTWPQLDRYIEHVVHALLDRHISADEFESLRDTALQLGLTVDGAHAAHLAVVNLFVLNALKDGSLTEFEATDLGEVCDALGVSRTELDGLIARVRHPRVARAGQSAAAGSPEYLKGKSICFSGELQARIRGDRVTRNLAEYIATQAGLRVQASVTKSLDFLVLADPLSMSRKAKKARDDGVQILSEAVFWAMVGEAVE